MKAVSRRLLHALGWTLHFSEPGVRRYVLIVAPHTSNWDFPLGMLAAWALGLDVHFMGKHTLFEGPFGWLFRALGGIPVDRKASGGLVEQVAARFEAAQSLVLAVTPEGTRGRSTYWKSGFWRIARAAGVPIVMATLDYGRKEIVVSEPFTPGEDRDADFDHIRAFYAGRRGKRPELQGEVHGRPGAPAGAEAAPGDQDYGS